MKSFDKAFKKLFEDTFILYEFIKMFLPALVDEYGVTQESIEIQNTEFLSADLKTKLADVLAYVKTEKTEKFIYILIEHQSYKDQNMAFRMYDYTAKIWSKYIKDNYPRSRRKDFKYPQVIPIVFYTGEGRWTPAKNISDKVDYAKGFEKYTPKYEYFVVELSQLDKDWLLKVKTILSKLLYVVKVEDIEEIFKELKAEVDELDKDKKRNSTAI